MSTVKCPTCNLINFATAQFCKRCNLELDRNSVPRSHNETQIHNPVNRTHIRQNPQPQKPELQPTFYQPAPSYQQPQQEQFYQYALPQFPQGYQPPRFNSPPNPQYFQPKEVAYRRLGSEIALHKNGSLPEICVKCGQELSAYNGGAFVAQKYRWHHPALYVALISPIIYLILSLCLSERATINVPLCNEHLKSRETAKNVLICGGVISLFLVILSINFGWVGFGFLVFFAGLLSLTAVSEYGYKPIRIKRSEGSYYHLAGASDEFTARIPF